MFMLQIQVTSIEEAERILACLKHAADPAAVQQVEEQLTGGTADVPVTPVEPEKPKNPRGRPRREKAEPLPESAAPAAEPTAEAAPDANAPATEQEPQSYTLADVRSALQGVQAKNPSNMQPCLDLLAKFGAARVSEVKEADYAAFVAACKAA